MEEVDKYFKEEFLQGAQYSKEIKEFYVSNNKALEAANAIGIRDGKGPEGSRKVKSIDDIIAGAKDTTNNAGVARNYEKTGGFEKTLEDFESLGPSNVKDIQTQYGSGKVGTLSDGTKVVARPGSKTGGSTLEIKVSNKKIYKIRY